MVEFHYEDFHDPGRNKRSVACGVESSCNIVMEMASYQQIFTAAERLSAIWFHALISSVIRRRFNHFRVSIFVGCSGCLLE